MKNQLLNLKMIALMCLMMVLGGANVWAEDVTLLTADYTWNADASKSVSQTVSGVTFSFVGGTTKPTYYPKNGLRLYEGCKVSISSDDDISQIVFTYTVSNYGVLNDVTLGSWNDSKKTWTGSAKSVSLTVGHSSGSNNGQVRLTKIVVTKAQSKTLTSLAISGEPSKKTYEVGEEFDPTGLVVTGNYDDKSTATITDGITWTKTPATLSLSDVACSVTATVGGITSPAYKVTGLTVNEAKLPSTTDATFGPDWNKLFGTSYDGTIPSVKANKLELNGVSNGVKIKVTNGTSTAGYVKTNDFRLYGKYTITITAPKDVLLSEITMTSQTKKSEFKITENKITSNVGSVKLDGKDLKWIGSSNEILFEFSDKVSLSTIKVATKAAAEPTYTAQTLKFIAKDGDDYYATFSNDKVTFIPYDVLCEPYTIVVSKGNIEKTVIKQESADINGEAVKGYFIPANTGVLLYSLAETADYYTVENKTVDAFAEGTNMLMPAPTNGGVFEATDGYKYYKLAYGNWTNKTQLGFYWGADNGAAFYVKAGTAYLAVPAGENAAKGFTLNGEVTGIEGVNVNVENAKAIYNLNGQRVASMAKPGLYIVNGKKVVRK